MNRYRLKRRFLIAGFEENDYLCFVIYIQQ